MERSIIILAKSDDAHVNHLRPFIEERGFDVIQLSRRDIPLKDNISIQISMDKEEFLLHRDNRFYNLNHAKSFWYRRMEPHNFPGHLTQRQEGFARAEFSQAFLGLLNTLPKDLRWIDHPRNIDLATFELVQLKTAKHSGFFIPRTLITSNYEEALSFFQLLKGNVIYKTLSTPSLIDFSDRVYVRPSFSERMDLSKGLETKTTRVTREMVESMRNPQFAPCEFQELIIREKEFRITVIGKKAFIVEIKSPENSNDWRNHYGNLEYIYTKNDELEMLCLRLSGKLNLSYCAIDVIMDKNGNYYLLDVNPTGQFLWLEFALEHSVPMSKALVDLIVGEDD